MKKRIAQKSFSGPPRKNLTFLQCLLKISFDLKNCLLPNLLVTDIISSIDFKYLESDGIFKMCL